MRPMRETSVRKVTLGFAQEWNVRETMIFELVYRVRVARSAASRHPGRVPLALGRRRELLGRVPLVRRPPGRCGPADAADPWRVVHVYLIFHRLIARTLFFPVYRPFRLHQPLRPTPVTINGLHP